MIRYNPGDIILVNIAFSGTEGYKQRPAVVISTDMFNVAGIKLVVAAVTGNVLPPYRPGDTLIHDWKTAGLLKPSAVRGVIATVDKSDIRCKLGTLAPTDFIKIEQGIADILGFIVSSLSATN
ncbi:MAG: type II toxin-antitoxin system PemK/MazF family toxin [Candidatus Omnitrophota bacterium]|jgi:mRNA interferase MazF|nr:MAG: type II toxin-antitoxin system PemK/MazF family toxin [Candidatus Omnitrophota bacterium]